MKLLVDQVEIFLEQKRLHISEISRYDLLNIANKNNIPMHMDQAIEIMHIIHDALINRKK